MPHRWIAALRHELSTRVLPAYLPTRRWFAAKARRIVGAESIAGHVVSDDDGRALTVEYLRVRFDDASSQDYQLPLLVSEIDESAEPIASIEYDGRRLHVSDGAGTPEFAAWLLARFASPRVSAIDHARLRTLHVGVGPFPDFSLNAPRISGAQQSHTNIVLGDRALLKAFRKLDEGLNPEIELGRFLLERTSFRDMPQLHGALELLLKGAPPRAIAMLQEFVPSRGQGWEWMRSVVADHFQNVVVDRIPDERAVWVGEVVELARQTARLHAALASVDHHADFAVEPFEPADAKRVLEDIATQARRTRACLPQALIDGELRSQASRLLDYTDSWLAREPDLMSGDRLGKKMRIHGDYHLGQTLRTDRTYVILDFEGEPGKTIAERRRKQSPLRDVAGMLRSLDYVSQAAAQEVRDRARDNEQLQEAAARWSKEAQMLFAAQYRKHLARESPDLGGPEELLRAFLVEKALYELEYELNNRPDWVAIPLAGLKTLARG